MLEKKIGPGCPDQNKGLRCSDRQMEVTPQIRVDQVLRQSDTCCSHTSNEEAHVAHALVGLAQKHLVAEYLKTQLIP